ncbi:tyramine beta hydroxylase [Tachypleus tridentatus]|uniref:tyramine beta hydroxylase n=1 Tax=Tachypleus tridentatus TaxID=6853 RepID=UPI003FD3AD21
MRERFHLIFGIALAIAQFLFSMGLKEEMQVDTTPGSYFDVPLDHRDRFHLYWTINYVDKEVIMEVRAHLNTNDWIGVGFSDRGNISNADLCIFWVDRQGDSHFQDVWTDEAGYISVDYHDDCPLMALRRRDHITHFVFNRRFDTCDVQDYVIEDGTTHVVYATGKGPLRRLEGLRLTKEDHDFQRVQLLKTLDPPPVLPESTKIFSVTNDRVQVPDLETTYWCSLHKLPDEFNDKHHMVKYETDIQHGNEPVVHHMEVFHCEVPDDLELPHWNGPCFDKTKPAILETCKRVLAAWAMGAPPFYYPEEAGLPIGGNNFSHFLMLEVHYNNPELRDDWVDSSGMRLFYTNELRPHDAGILEVGLEYTDKMAIPPKQKVFELNGYCVAECTRTGLPPEGITIFASQLHTHLTGTRVFTKHSRGGVELPELNRDNHYSTHFQEIRFLKQRVQLFPGDALITTCRYTTVDREKITLGGFAISDEMCVNYMHYFPKTNLEVCKSSIDSQALNAFFGYMNEYHDEATALDRSVHENYHAIHWSQHNADFLNRLYQSAPISMQCNQSSGDRFPGYWNGVPITEILYSLPSTPSSCVEKGGKEGILSEV